MYICICNAVTDDEIREAALDGCTSMSELGARTGAGTGCGSCVDSASQLLDEVHVCRASQQPRRGGRQRTPLIRVSPWVFQSG